MAMSKKQPKVIIEEARYGVRLNHVLFPLDFRDLRHALAKNGYELSQPPRGLPGPPTRVRYGGDVARKGEISVIVESDSGEIGLVGRSLKEVKEAFEELSQITDSELGISLHENVRFHWCIVHFKVDTGKIPSKEIAKAENKDYIRKFGQVLGEDLSLFSVRVYPKDAIPNAENWFDIAIEPDILNDKLYHVGVVFRSPDKRKSETFVRNLENNILKLIKVIEA